MINFGDDELAKQTNISPKVKFMPVIGCHAREIADFWLILSLGSWQQR
ncbi:hypothetical protein ymoll0001_21530 [Yersinia mollaretii ATCC 43969]|uniref:Uncharacterized protein n=1 Tax=Yersinia mollaretii (strain ATCC 43969 / DSM 18520 / CIP 103324 / CNY 7263 / WAIP 204) TaxID=349967 RepID=A0ABP2EHN0_YERMW|nr:hypothetical protein ymoll0001_21530 [Yersinia mollaretii ATCC 43969]